ncbi:MAG: U32 family peptidase [Cellulosilyticum sp.]|nr:U32 family peptidase [Cellulosilyticum sp.]
MRALVPLSSIEHVDDYIKCGAGEFYMGFYDPKWTEAFGDFADINRMSGYKEGCNPHTLEEVLNIIKQMKKKKKLIYITFNSSIYGQAQYPYLKKYMEALKEVNVDGVIVSCVELVELAKKVGVASVVSTIAGVYNREIAKFYADRGAKRIILPRDLSTDEIESIVKAVPEVEYEVFMMRNGCAFSDANCLGMHRKEMCSICSSIMHADTKMLMQKEDFNNKNAVELNNMIYTNSFHQFACGLCSIYRFVKLGITAGKIVGRCDEWRNICRDIEYMKKNIEIAQQCDSEEEYLEQMIFPEDRNIMCKLGLSCYYPEIRY